MSSFHTIQVVSRSSETQLLQMGTNLNGLAQAEIIKKIGDFILAFLYDHMM